MWRGYSMARGHRESKWAWLSSVLLVIFGVVIYASVATEGADVEVGENRCFPVHWCIPGTAESVINTDDVIEVREGRCFPARWCISGTATGSIRRQKTVSGDTTAYVHQNKFNVHNTVSDVC